MQVLHTIWRPARSTSFGLRERAISEALKEQHRAEAEMQAALQVLKMLVSDSEYERMVAECERGEREVRLENGVVVTHHSPFPFD